MKQKKKYQLELPPDVVTSLHLEHDAAVELTVKGEAATIRAIDPNKDKIQRQLELWAGIPAVIATIVFWAVATFRNVKQVPISGEYSIASWLIIANIFVGTIIFTTFFVKSRRANSSAASNRIYWRNFPVIVMAFLLILGLALLGISWLMGQVFVGVSFDLVTSSFIFLIFAFVINYAMALAAINIDSSMLTTLFTVTIVSGVIISMIDNGRDRWWQHNLSFLGTDLAKNSWQFNFTLVFSALIMVALIDYLFVSLQETVPRTWKINLLRALLTATAIDLGAVGVFPNNANFHVLHDRLAFLLVDLMIILIVGIRWLLPQVSKEFLLASYILGASLVACEIAFQFVGYLSLTAFEIISFVVAFGWVILLFQKIRNLTDGVQFVVKVPIKVKRVPYEK
ncbi:DUF998 domain-containing protein [Lapidilactobacillus mulanensis]|uniref:DUF998 domain-containing protein n=1 Tax=Lapidilactobacillus mulanensis TaxID=2485999 RepID=A0ABW4DNZ9_9LACO|nr:DUF998 domain-containing protein [Lapidilactobacillus mulanensis]